MSEIGIGVIGSGFMGRTNAETISKYLRGARLAGIAGGTRAAQLAADYGVTCEPTVESLLDRRDVDAVFISTPHSEHAENAIAAAERGKHILLDKPMATSVAGCDQIIEAAVRANVKLMIMFGQRFRTVNMEARRLIQDGAIGRVTAIHSYSINTGGLKSLPPWQSRPENLGTLIGHGVHNIDQIRWFTGDEISTVSARVEREPPSNNEVSTMALLGLRGGERNVVGELDRAGASICEQRVFGASGGRKRRAGTGRLQLFAAGTQRRVGDGGRTGADQFQGQRNARSGAAGSVCAAG